MSEENIKFLRGVEFLKSLNEEDVKHLASDLQEVKFHKGQVICEEGSTGDSILFIKDGIVEILSIDGQKVIDTEKPNSFIGEMALVFDIKRTATVSIKHGINFIKIKNILSFKNNKGESTD